MFNSKSEYEKLTAVVHALLNVQNLVISRDSEDICLQTLLLLFSLDVKNFKQNNSLFRQPIVLWLAY